jgi:hypothetical protein
VRCHNVAIGVAALALCAWCGWVSGYHRSSGPAEVTWLLTVAAVLLIDVLLRRQRSGGRAVWRAAEPWPRPGRGGSGPALRGVSPWVALIVIALAWDVLGIDSGPHQYHLTISALAQAYRPLNAALLLVWVLAGIGYQVARVRAPIEPTPAPGGANAPDAPKHGGAFALAVGPLGIHHGTPALLLPQSPGVGVAFWLVVPVAALLIDVVARHSQGRWATAEEFVRFISSARIANVALTVVWLVAGYHLFAR